MVQEYRRGLVQEYVRVRRMAYIGNRFFIFWFTEFKIIAILFIPVYKNYKCLRKKRIHIRPAIGGSRKRPPRTGGQIF